MHKIKCPRCGQTIRIRNDRRISLHRPPKKPNEPPCPASGKLFDRSRFELQCVDAHALYHALLRQQSHSVANGVSNVELDTVEGIPNHPPALIFTVDRYAMDGNGFHVGYEQFTGSLPLYPLKPVNHKGGSTPFSEWYVVPCSLDVDDIEPAEEPREYTVTEAIEFLDEWSASWREDEFGDTDPPGEDVIQLAFDEGMGDGDYCQPDEDFAYQELLYTLNETLEDLPVGLFHWDESGRYWTLEFADGEVVETYWIERINDERA